MDIKPSYMSQKVFDNNLVPIRKNKITLTLNKPACVGMFNLFTARFLKCVWSFYNIMPEKVN